MKPSAETRKCGSKTAVVIVGVASVVAAIFSAVAWLALFVSLGNGTDTENLIIFTVFMGVLCPFCATTGAHALYKGGKFSIAGFVVLTMIVGIVTFAITVADWATADCEQNVIRVQPCAPDEKQDPLTTVGFGVAVWSLLLVVIVAGLRVHHLIINNRYLKIIEGDKDGEERNRGILHNPADYSSPEE